MEKRSFQSSNFVEDQNLRKKDYDRRNQGKRIVFESNFTEASIIHNFSSRQRKDEHQSNQLHGCTELNEGYSMKRKRNSNFICDRELHDSKKVLIEDFEKLNLSCVTPSGNKVEIAQGNDTHILNPMKFNSQSKDNHNIVKKEKIVKVEDQIKGNELLVFNQRGNRLARKTANFYDLQQQLRQKFCPHQSTANLIPTSGNNIIEKVSNEIQKDSTPFSLTNKWTFVKPAAIRKKSTSTTKSKLDPEFSSSPKRFYQEFSKDQKIHDSVLVYDHRSSGSNTSKGKGEQRIDLTIPLPAGYITDAGNDFLDQKYQGCSHYPISKYLPNQTKEPLSHGINYQFEEEYIRSCNVDKISNKTSKIQEMHSEAKNILEREEFSQNFNSQSEDGSSLWKAQVRNKRILKLKKNREKRQIATKSSCITIREEEREKMLVRALAGCGTSNAAIYRNPIDESIDKLIRRTSAKFVRDLNEDIIEGGYAVGEFDSSQKTKSINIGEMNREDTNVAMKERISNIYGDTILELNQNSMRYGTSSYKEVSKNTSSIISNERQLISSNPKQTVLSLCDAPWGEIEERKALQIFIDYNLTKSFSEVNTDESARNLNLDVSKAPKQISRGSTFRLIPFNQNKWNDED